jgi:hypothetical protein
MTRQLWILFLTLSVSLPILSPTAKACAWDDTYGESFYTFFPPKMHNFEALEAFHFTYERLFDYDLLGSQASQTPNIAEWARYFGVSGDSKELQGLIYTSVEEDLRGTLAYLDGKRGTPVPKFKDYALMPVLQAGKFREAVAYLLFAKQTEPYVNGYDEWSGEKPRGSAQAQKRAGEALKNMRSAKDERIKFRYAYQAVRLYHYYGQEAEAIQTFESNFKDAEKRAGLIYWWSLSDYAGALRNTGREAEAAYQFSRVWDQCPSRRIQAWYGWRILSDEVWDQTIARCKDNHEKAIQHFLRAYSPDAVAASDIEAIQRLEPNSKLVEFLVLREINKLESEVLRWPGNIAQPMYQGFKEAENASVRDQVSELKRLIETTLRSASGDKDFWVLADAYLSFLMADFEAATAKLKAAQPTLSPLAALRARFLLLAVRIASTRQIDPATEAALFDDVSRLRKELNEESAGHLASFLDEAMGWLYEKQGQAAKARLARNQYYALFDRSSVAEVEAMIAFAAKPNLSAYEQLLFSRMGESAVESLEELRATRMMAEGRYADAVAVMEKLPEAYRKKSTTFQLKANPFQGRITDIVHCDENACEDFTYNKLSYAKRVVSLQASLKQDPANAARHHLELGHAMYNTTFFGPGWHALDYFRSAAGWYYFGEDSEWYQFDPKNFDEVIDMAPAEQHYRLAMALAKDPELAAEACYYAAKCEQNRGYMEGTEMANYRENFALLSTRYRDTEFQQRLKTECRYYASYLNR